MSLLIVDDEQNIRNGLKAGVDWASVGIDRVYSAQDGGEALAVCEKYPVDIIISDIRMSGVDGMELGARLAILYPDIKIILLSGYADFEYARKAIQFGAVEYLQKPVKIPELLACVKKLVVSINSSLRVKEEEAKNQRQNEIINLMDKPGQPDKVMKGYEGFLMHDRIFGEKDFAGYKKYSPMITLALNFIYANCSRDITVDDVAVFLKKSNNYFSSQFKKEIGMSFVEYLNRLRVEQAKVLLTQTTMMTYEISSLVGFNDYKYFSVVFRKSTGKSPSQYRKELGDAPPES